MKINNFEKALNISNNDVSSNCARKDNGVALWEKESALNCYNYMITNSFSSLYAKSCSQLILKKEDIESQILYDVDVLDYHRFFILDEEQENFDKSRLFF